MALQDFLTYTEVDPNGRITVAKNKIDAFLARDEIAYLHSGNLFGVDHFGNFEHLVKATMQSKTANPSTVSCYMLSNDLGDEKGLSDANKTFINVRLNNNSDGDEFVALFTRHAGATRSDNFAAALATPYYLTIKKVGTALTCMIYSDATRETLLATLSVVCHADHKYRYVFGCASLNTGTAGRLDADIEDLDLQEAPRHGVVNFQVPGIV